MIDITLIIAPVISAVFGAGAGAVGAYIAMTNRLTALETKLDALSKSVEKHNGVIERTFKAETAISNIYHRLDDIRNEVHHYHQ